MFCCPLCEENVSDCNCGFGAEKENDKSITLTSEDDRRFVELAGWLRRNVYAILNAII